MFGSMAARRDKYSFCVRESCKRAIPAKPHISFKRPTSHIESSWAPINKEMSATQSLFRKRDVRHAVFIPEKKCPPPLSRKRDVRHLYPGKVHPEIHRESYSNRKSSRSCLGCQTRSKQRPLLSHLSTLGGLECMSCNVYVHASVLWIGI